MTGWTLPLDLPRCRFVRRPTRAFARSVARAARRGRYRGVLVTFGATDTRWFHTLVRASSAVCLIRGRRLVRASGDVDLFGVRWTRAGQALGCIALCFGDGEEFSAVWREHGAIGVPSDSRDTCPGHFRTPVRDTGTGHPYVIGGVPVPLSHEGAR